MKERVEKLLPRDLRSEKQLYMSGRKDVRKREIFNQKSLEAWHKITDWNAFTEFANEQGGKTQSEMAKLWGNISRQTIHRALKNIGFTRKKRPTDTKKEMRKSELNLQML